jgi:hypothetical protein
MKCKFFPHTHQINFDDYSSSFSLLTRQRTAVFMVHIDTIKSGVKIVCKEFETSKIQVASLVVSEPGGFVDANSNFVI